LVHVAGEAADGRSLPARIDEFMRELEVAQAQVAGNRFDQVARLGKAVDQRIGVERKRKGHVVLKQLDWRCRTTPRKRRVRLRSGAGNAWCGDRECLPPSS